MGSIPLSMLITSTHGDSCPGTISELSSPRDVTVMGSPGLSKASSVRNPTTVLSL